VCPRPGSAVSTVVNVWGELDVFGLGVAAFSKKMLEIDDERSVVYRAAGRGRSAVLCTYRALHLRATRMDVIL
jgi:hypothetical protein